MKRIVGIPFWLFIEEEDQRDKINIAIEQIKQITNFPSDTLISEYLKKNDVNLNDLTSEEIAYIIKSFENF